MLQEADLIKRIRQREETAFSELFDAYQKKALRTATLIAGNRADGEDIVQEAFVKCYLNIATLKNDAYFPSWFYQILTRTAWDFCRGRKETPVAEFFEDGEMWQEKSALEDYITNEEETEMLNQIKKLDVKHRIVVILYYYNEMSIKEIAAALSCMEGTVKSRLHAARRLLKKNMELEWKKEGEGYRHAKFGSIG